MPRLNEAVGYGRPPSSGLAQRGASETLSRLTANSPGYGRPWIFVSSLSFSDGLRGADRELLQGGIGAPAD